MVSLHLDNKIDQSSHFLSTYSAMHFTHIFPSQNYDTHTFKDMEGRHRSSCWKLILLIVIAIQLCVGD